LGFKNRKEKLHIILYKNVRKETSITVCKNYGSQNFLFHFFAKVIHIEIFLSKILFWVIRNRTIVSLGAKLAGNASKYEKKGVTKFYLPPIRELGHQVIFDNLPYTLHLHTLYTNVI